MYKLKLDNFSIVLPCRLDSTERLENIIFTSNKLLEEFDTNIIVIEVDNHNNLILKRLLDGEIKYHFYFDNDPVFYRTKYLNLITAELDTPFVGIWDTDVIAPFDQVVQATEILRNGEADFVYPYDKYFLDTSTILRKLYMRENKIEFLMQNMKKMKEMYPPNPVGGAFLANLKAYKESGLENENFYGWGLEDGERFYRWESMGYKIKRVPGPLFHLSHGRGLNSTFHDTDQHLLKRKEILNAVRSIAPSGNPTPEKLTTNSFHGN